MVFRILPHELRAKASAEGPCGNRALQRKADPLGGNAPKRTEAFLLRPF